MVRAAHFETAIISFQWITKIIRIWKFQFSSFALSFSFRLKQRETAKLNKKIHTDDFIFLA